MSERVRVWNGSRSKLLGDGNYVGDVALHFFLMPDGSLKSQSNAEDEPSKELLAEMEQAGARHMKVPNPKIELDNGEVVYGCQTWWAPISRLEDS